jgi:hypothetical protein
MSVAERRLHPSSTEWIWSELELQRQAGGLAAHPNLEAWRQGTLTAEDVRVLRTEQGRVDDADRGGPRAAWRPRRTARCGTSRRGSRQTPCAAQALPGLCSYGLRLPADRHDVADPRRRRLAVDDGRSTHSKPGSPTSSATRTPYALLHTTRAVFDTLDDERHVRTLAAVSG